MGMVVNQVSEVWQNQNVQWLLKCNRKCLTSKIHLEELCVLRLKEAWAWLKKAKRVAACFRQTHSHQVHQRCL